MSRTAWAFAVATLFPMNALAMTGAELLQADRSFAEGYVYGVLHRHLFVVNGNASYDKKLSRQRSCFMEARMDNSTIYDFTARYIRNHPASLKDPAFASVLSMVSEVCPWN